MEATYLRDGRWAVRPKGQLGTCGFHPIAWSVVIVRARSADEAIRKAGDQCFNFEP
jgi:hypothetical protein